MADGDPVVQGTSGPTFNQSQTPNQLSNGAGAGADGTGMYLFSGQQGTGLYVVGQGQAYPGTFSYSYQGDGVVGYAGGAARAPDACGVRGRSTGSNGAGVTGSNPNFIGVVGSGSIGMLGTNTGDFGIGVEGNGEHQGSIGVFGMSTGERGIGVYATANAEGSAALQVNGRAVFSSSGQIVVPAGATSASVSGLTLSASASVLATLQQDLPGVSVRAAVPDPATGTVTVHLSAAPGVDATVGWMAVN